MFGHHDDQSAPPTEAEQADKPSGEPTQPPAIADQDVDISATIAPDSAQTATTTAPPAPAGDPAWQHPGTPVGGSSQAGPPKSSAGDDQNQVNDVISPAGGFPKKPTFSNRPAEPESDDSVTALLKSKTIPADTSDQELMDIRQKALTELRPIVDKLDLPPEEKFRTIMMIIQISDDEALVKAAYDAAHAITDDKDRAQALLDIVNEVNYFTHQPDAEK